MGSSIIDQRPSFSGYYERPLNRVLFRWIDRRKVSIINRALSILPPNAIVIDVGCGSGRILQRVERVEDLRVACDHDPLLLRVARSRGLEPVLLDFEQPLPFSDCSVDAALSIDAIEHSTDPRLVLAELRRVLRPGGLAIVFTPPYDSVRWILSERLHGLVTGRPADHIAPFTRESLEWAVSRYFDDYRIGRTNANLTMYVLARKAGGPPREPTG